MDKGLVVTLHLQQFAERVAGVVDDYNAINGDPQVSKDDKRMFSLACMNDVAVLTNILSQFVKETLAANGIEIPAPTAEKAPSLSDPPIRDPQDDEGSVADVIDLNAYKANGGLLN